MNGIRESFLSLDLFSLTFKNIFSGFLTRGIGIRESFLSLDLFSLTFENIFSGFLTTEGSELERVFCRWIYFHLRSKIFFWPSYGGGRSPPSPPHGSCIGGEANKISHVRPHVRLFLLSLF